MDGAVVAALLATLVVEGSFLTWMIRRAWRHTPAGVMAALRKHGGAHQVRVHWGAVGGIWNPAKPLGPNNPLFTPGAATYHWDDDDHVRLDWRPIRGEPAEYEGQSLTA